ncbi:hypothetical protein GBAR_LOCUS7579 [Geodia barretti]|uniref:Uncharacterized protein n=1 Tax=Geodia barretti TaxID=519541 RepID=A0AA35RHY3_GEOBA|nr:hypothetical protein GBAR_LOCUS7579 [Geodia barretti]
MPTGFLTTIMDRVDADLLDAAPRCGRSASWRWVWTTSMWPRQRGGASRWAIRPECWPSLPPTWRWLCCWARRGARRRANAGCAAAAGRSSFTPPTGWDRMCMKPAWALSDWVRSAVRSPSAPAGSTWTSCTTRAPGILMPKRSMACATPSFPDLLAQADFVVLSVPLTPQRIT